MKKQNILICIDRDGTLIYDDKYYLGRTNNWRSKIKFLRNVVRGLREVNKRLPLAKIYMITNQSGVAVKDFPFLTEKRANEVCQAVIDILSKKGVRVDDYVLCPHVSLEYAEKSELKIKKNFICNCSCIKPSPGMVAKALRKEKFKKENTRIYVIGDRKTDVETAHNISGIGILVPFKNESKEDVKLLKHKKNKFFKDRTHLAENFLDAVRYIIRKEK